jgi:hypothetical protein
MTTMMTMMTMMMMMMTDVTDGYPKPKGTLVADVKSATCTGMKRRIVKRAKKVTGWI